MSHRWRDRGDLRSHALGPGRLRSSDICADAHFTRHGLGWNRRGDGRQRIDSAGRARRVCGGLLVAIPSRFESATISVRLTSTLQRQFKSTLPRQFKSTVQRQFEALCGGSSKAPCSVSPEHSASSVQSTLPRQCSQRA
jgi:hypothetical protein